jgi:putative transcriptional regulator
VTGLPRLTLAAVGAAVLLTVAGIGARAAAQRPSPIGDLTGQLLVATPLMPDPRFMRTVIYMVQHDSGGTMGLVLNRPMVGIPLARLLEQLAIESNDASGTIRTHYGGPVERTRGFVLHTADYVGKSTLLIKDGVGMTWQPEIWRVIASGAGPRRRLFVLGHSGWAPGQLEAEMGAGHWVAVPADEALVFDEDYDGKWPRAMARRRINL